MYTPRCAGSAVATGARHQQSGHRFHDRLRSYFRHRNRRDPLRALSFLWGRERAWAEAIRGKQQERKSPSATFGSAPARSFDRPSRRVRALPRPIGPIRVSKVDCPENVGVTWSGSPGLFPVDCRATPPPPARASRTAPNNIREEQFSPVLAIISRDQLENRSTKAESAVPPALNSVSKFRRQVRDKHQTPLDRQS